MKKTASPGKNNPRPPDADVFPAEIFLEETPAAEMEGPPRFSPRCGRLVGIGIGFSLLAALFAISRYNYLLFHGIAELFSIAVAWGVFMLVWNSRRFLNNDAMVVLGIGYLFVGFLDLIHTLAYKGMGVFPEIRSVNYATQLWIAARFLESFTLLTFALLLGKRKIPLKTIVSVFSVLAALTIFGIFHWEMFPDCYVEGVGLTVFKKTGEYVISAVLIGSAALMVARSRFLHEAVLRLMLVSVGLTACAEIFFTFYISVYGFSNLAGHYFKIVSFFLVYIALIRSGLTRPYEVLFNELRREKESLKQSERRFRSLAQSVPDHILVLNSDLRASFVNHAFPGFEKEDLIGARIFDRVFREDRERVEKLLESVLVQGEGLTFESILHTPEQRSIHYESSVTLYPSETGQPRLLLVARDVTRRKQNEALLETRLRIREYSTDCTTGQLLKKTLDEAEKLTGSRIGFLHFINEDQDMIEAQVWSSNTMEKACKALDFDRQRPLEKAGVWADAIRERKPVIHNDYEGLAHRGGIPEGHVPVVRELVAPVMRSNRVEAVLGVGNKPEKYVDADVDAIVELADMAWDVIVRRRAEDAARARETSYRALFEQSNDAIFVHLVDGNIVDANLKACSLTGFSKERLLELSVRDLHPEKAAAASLEALERTLQAGETRFESIFRKSDGSVVDVEISSCLADPEKGVVLGIVRDIAERKQAQKALRESRRMMSTLLGNLPGIAFRCRNDRDWSMEYLSNGCLELTGYVPGELVRNRVLSYGDVIHPEHRQEVWDAVQSALADGKTYEIEYRIVSKENLVKWVWEKGVGIANEDGDIRMVEGFIADITKRKEDEETLWRLRKQLTGILEHSPALISVLDGEGRYHLVNPVLAASLGTTPERMIGKTFREVLPPETADTFNARIRKLYRQRRAFQFQEKVVFNGSMKSYTTSLFPLFDARGDILSACAISMDVTDLRKAKMEKERLASAIEQVAEAIVVTARDGGILYVNPAFEKITGYSKEEVMGRNPRLLKSGRQGRPFYREFWRTILSGGNWQGRFVDRKKNGELFTVEASVSPVFDDAGEIRNFVAVKRDITEELRLAERLQQAQKMEAIGVLAGGIAHDFNNILFPMVGLTEMLQEDLAEDSPLRANTREILNAAFRARDLVKQIMYFSRQTDQEKDAVRVQTVLKEALKLSRASLPSNIEIISDIRENCPPVLADPSKLHQIVMNLITNAFHAMETSGGKLEVKLKPAHASADDESLRPGTYTYLTVSDTGAGIDRSIVNRIFEPYFTTKEKGKGTGLGLSVVHGIVLDLGGEIRVESEPGAGTTIHVFLPCIEEKNAEKSLSPDDSIRGGNERVLFVDDEEPIARMVERMLKRLGYRVDATTSSVRAFEIFKKDPGWFDLIVTDMTMPAMTGLELAAKIKQIDQEIPVIVCTGFSEQVNEENLTELGLQGYVMKPLVKSELAEAVRSALDGTKSG